MVFKNLIICNCEYENNKLNYSYYLSPWNVIINHRSNQLKAIYINNIFGQSVLVRKDIVRHLSQVCSFTTITSKLTYFPLIPLYTTIKFYLPTLYTRTKQKHPLRFAQTSRESRGHGIALQSKTHIIIKVLAEKVANLLGSVSTHLSNPPEQEQQLRKPQCKQKPFHKLHLELKFGPGFPASRSITRWLYKSRLRFGLDTQSLIGRGD